MMKVRLWGVRGSLPAPVTPQKLQERFMEFLLQFDELRTANPSLTARDYLNTLPANWVGGYGGNTSCAEVLSGTHRLIIDGGSGIRNLYEHTAEHDPECKEFHIYITHFHWDHLIGLPFFLPFYKKGFVVHFYGAHDDLAERIREIFRKPYFPVPFESIQNQIRFHVLRPRTPFQLNCFTLTPYLLDHPDPCWGVRVQANGKSLAWAVDTECTRTTADELGEDAKLYRNADLMVFDAQYSFEEVLQRISWGHSSGPIGIDLAIQQGVRQALFVHHDPAASDQKIREAEAQSQNYFEEISRARVKSGIAAPTLRWHFAREGEVIEL